MMLARAGLIQASGFYHTRSERLQVMKHFIISLTAILFFTGVLHAQSNDSNSRCRGLNKNVVALISQYKELREKRRQLPPGTYDRDLSDDGGKLHEVLFSLGVELGRPPYTKRDIVECLGEPDAIKNEKWMSNYLDIYNRELKKSGRKVEKKDNREYLIYFWRGGHDFIFFISEAGMIVDHGWWFAYE
jgi:hypothetical protein